MASALRTDRKRNPRQPATTLAGYREVYRRKVELNGRKLITLVNHANRTVTFDRRFQTLPEFAQATMRAIASHDIKLRERLLAAADEYQRFTTRHTSSNAK